MPAYTAGYTKLNGNYMGQLFERLPIEIPTEWEPSVEHENLSHDEEAALEKFLEDERNGTLITYSAEEVRRHL